MIEQTELVVSEWKYSPPNESNNESEKIKSFTTLDVMKKRASSKKGIACRFSCRFVYENKTILEYVGENSYVIDLEDKIDKKELLRMISNHHVGDPRRRAHVVLEDADGGPRRRGRGRCRPRARARRPWAPRRRPPGESAST